jgi:hypothetical protein
MWVLVHHDSSAAPQTVQTASSVCGTKNFSSVRLYSAPQLHRTIVAILGICPCGTPDQPQCLCPRLTVITSLRDRAEAVLELSTGRGGRRLEGRSRTKRPRLAGCKGRGRWRRVCSNAHFRQIIPAAIVTGVDRIRCSVTQIFRYRLSKQLPRQPTIPQLRSPHGRHARCARCGSRARAPRPLNACSSVFRFSQRT